MTRPTHALTHALAHTLAAALLAGAAGAQTGIPRGGKEIAVGAGSRLVQIQVRNDTNTTVRDVTVASHEADGQTTARIRSLDVTELSSDDVDDNGDGRLTIDEFDTNKDPGPHGVVKSIFGSESVAPGATVTLNIELDRNTTRNTRLTVKFSTEHNGRHWDLLAVAGFAEGETERFVPVAPGAPQAGSRVDNSTGRWVYDVVLPVNPQNPIIDVELPGDYRNSLVVPQQDAVIIQLDPPVPPGDRLDLYFEYESPIYIPDESFYQPIFILPGPPPCRADLNEDGVVDTRDYIEFLNLFNMRDPDADWNHDGLINTLDLLAFQNDWTHCR